MEGGRWRAEGGGRICSSNRHFYPKYSVELLIGYLCKKVKILTANTSEKMNWKCFLVLYSTGLGLIAGVSGKVVYLLGLSVCFERFLTTVSKWCNKKFLL